MFWKALILCFMSIVLNSLAGDSSAKLLTWIMLIASWVIMAGVIILEVV